MRRSPLGFHGVMTEIESNIVSKVRLRFAKTDDLRFLSHHDLMRLLERLLRRASLPFRSTAGFHPKPKIAFASALGLGIVGRQEVVEVELEGMVDPDHVLSALSRLAPAGLQFLTATRISPRENAQPSRAVYIFPLSLDSFPDLRAKVQQLLAQDRLIVKRIRASGKKPGQETVLAEERLDALTQAEPKASQVNYKTIDIRPFINRLWCDDQGLGMDLKITNHGAARPEEVLRCLDLENIMLDGESILERVQLELEDEQARPTDLGIGSADSTEQVKSKVQKLRAVPSLPPAYLQISQTHNPPVLSRPKTESL
jgi:radical SAM-linked protein